MLTERNNRDSPIIIKNLKLSNDLDINQNNYLLVDNLENIYGKRASLSTRKINLLEERLKTDTNISRNKKLKIPNSNNNNCIHRKDCTYYKKYIKLKIEVENFLNFNKKLNLYNKSLFKSLEQKSKDFKNLLEENTLLKKALMKLNGITYNDLIKMKIKDFKINSYIFRNKNISYEQKNNKHIIINSTESHKTNKIFKPNKPENIKKYSNNPTSSNTIIANNENKNENKNENQKENNIPDLNFSKSSSSDDNSFEDSYFKNIKEKKSEIFNKQLSNITNNSLNNNFKRLSLNNSIHFKNQQTSNLYNKRNSIISQYRRKSDINIKIEESPSKQYDSMRKFITRKGRSSTIFTMKYSLLSLNIDLINIMNNNNNLNKLEVLTSSDEDFLSSIQNGSESQLLKYSDLINCLINDYKDMVKLGMRMKDFMKSSLLLVDSIISNDSSKVLIDNICLILKCDRSSLFLLDPTSDSLIVYSGEGLKRAQIKVPKDKGIVGACFMGIKKIRIDDAYADQRFNRDIDIKTNYRTRSILCFPLVDNDGKCFGVIEAINKLNSPFNDDDEELMKLLSRQASAIFKNAFYNDNNKFYIKKSFLLISYCNKIFHVNNKKEFSEKTEEFLLNLYNCMNSAFFFVENDKIIKYYKDTEIKKEFNINIGIVGKVYKTKDIIAFENIKRSCEFNSIIDLDSSSGILAFPILAKKTKNVCAIIEVPFSGDINNSGKPKENEINLIKNLSKCIKNWMFKFNEKA